MPQPLSPEVQQGLLTLKQQLRQFLKSFAKLTKKDPEYTQYGPKVNAMRALYFEIDSMELQASSEGGPASDGGTPKEDRKQRREDRAANNAVERTKKRIERETGKVERQEQRNDKAGNKEEAVFRFDKLMAMWNAAKFEEITADFRSYLDMAEQFLADARGFIDYAQSYVPGQFDNKIDQIKELITKIERFISVARNVSNQVDRYAKIVQDVVNITLELPRKVEDLKDGIVEEATKIFAAAKSFIATADTSDPEVSSNVEKLQQHLEKGQKKLTDLENLLGVITADENGDNLPDWYNRIEEKFNALIGEKNDLIPGTKVDDKVLLEIRALKASMDKFVAAASDKLEEFAEKVANVKQWLGKANEFISAITGFVENVKEGDLAVIYQDLKDFKAFIDSDKDILEGTKIDDKIKERLQEASQKAQTWLMNKLTGGDPDKEKEVRAILQTVDQLILSTGGVVDHSSKYEKDEDRINIPDITGVSDSEAQEVMERYGIQDMSASFEGILSDMKDQADQIRENVNAKFQASAQRGAQASAAFRDAKEEYDQAVKKHNDYFKATNVLGKRIINGLLTIAGVTIDSFAPGVGTAVKAVGQALMGDFAAVNREIDKIIPANLSIIGDLAKGVLPGVLPQIGSERGLIEIEGKTLLMGLNTLYINGITARYKEVVDLLNQMKASASNLGRNLRVVEQSREVEADKLAEVKKRVLVLELKWKGLKKDIEDKYVNINYPPIAKDKAYRYASRYLYSVWLIKFPSKEIRIGKALIKQFDKFGILTDANVEWKTGALSSLGRGFFGFLGVDPMGYREKVASLKSWATKENDTLKSAKAWSRVF